MTPRAIAALRSAMASPRVDVRAEAQSLAEYEARWLTQLVDRRALPARLDDDQALELSSYGGRRLTALVDGRVRRIDAPCYFKALRTALVRSLAWALAGGSHVLDLGSGAGKNLPVLRWAGAARVTAIEPTTSGCLATADLARRLGMAVSVVRAKLPEIPLVERWSETPPVVFTNHVLEQLPGRVPEAIEAIRAIQPRLVVHVEPILHPRGPVDDPLPTLVDAYYRRRRSYASDIWRTLRRHADAGHLIIEQVEHLAFSARVVNVPTVVVWRPAGSRVS